jgi:hypothetical protein
LVGFKKPDISIFLGAPAYLPETSYLDNGWRKTIPLFGFALYLFAINCIFNIILQRIRSRNAQI